MTNAAGASAGSESDFRRTVAWLLATWFGCGRSPKAPGTVGSLAALLPVIPMVTYGVAEWRWVVVALLAVFTLPGIWAAGQHARRYHRKDPQDVVVDEVLGLWLTIAFGTHLSWGGIALAFGLFRFFDIVKPPPVRQLERLPGGVGIVADDLAAGIYAGLVFYVAGCFNLY
ncbi:MAG: phosphatidylglycerophosphatase A [Bryobacterales bacterium]|nr:phosphatidylglycerophosphatase A [Bryobacterales bacterium]